MEDFILSSVGATFKKWRCCTHTPKEAQALTTCKGLQKNKIKGARKKKGEAYTDKLRPAASGQSLVATAGCHGAKRPVVANRVTVDRPVVAWSRKTSGQQLLVGSAVGDC
jgi:hypothetical protein